MDGRTMVLTGPEGSRRGVIVRLGGEDIGWPHVMVMAPEGDGRGRLGFCLDMDRCQMNPVTPAQMVELAAWLCELSGTGAAVLGRRGP
jgi:hypothetical protein